MESGTSERLVKLAEWNHNYFVTSLAVWDDVLITGDAINSVAVIQYVPPILRTQARDYSPLWPLCIETSDGRAIIGANVSVFLINPSRCREVNNQNT